MLKMLNGAVPKTGYRKLFRIPICGLARKIQETV
jgi:hypothetical protein